MLSRLPHGLLRTALAMVLLLSGLKLLNVPKASWILLTGLIALAVMLVGYGFLAWSRRPRPEPYAGASSAN